MLVVLWSAAATPLGAQEAEASPDAAPVELGATLEVFLVTAEPGDAIWELFSHNALLVRDSTTGFERSFNWGLFSFQQESFVARFAQGRMLYWMAGQDPAQELEGYRRAGRRVWSQRVSLTPAQRWQLLRYLLDQDTPENRFYRYDYFRDNCSTRVRDALDFVLGGQIERATSGVATEHGYRWHTSRLLQDELWAWAGIEYLLGNPSDRPISRWEEMFLPRKLQASLEPLTVLNALGEEVPLLGPRELLADTQRPEVPTEAPARVWMALLVGLAAAGGLGWLGHRAATGGRLARVVLGGVGGGWGLLSGLLGLALVLSWIYTGHVFWQWNENVMQLSPVALPLVILFPLAVAGRGGVWATRIALFCAGLSALGAVAQVVPGVDQVNGVIIAFALPINVSLAWALLQVVHREKGAPIG